MSYFTEAFSSSNISHNLATTALWPPILLFIAPWLQANDAMTSQPKCLLPHIDDVWFFAVGIPVSPKLSFLLVSSCLTIVLVGYKSQAKLIFFTECISNEATKRSLSEIVD